MTRPQKLIAATETIKTTNVGWSLVRARARLEAYRRRTDLARLERFCWFVGYERSGHSLVGTILTAHPEMVIAHERNLFELVDQGLSRSTILGLLLQKDHKFAKTGRNWTGYDYKVDGAVQGDWTHLRLIGDKMGAASALTISRRPGALADMRATIDLPDTVIHVTRHPLDNVARIATRNPRSLDHAIDRYLRMVHGVASTRERTPAERWVDLRHEDLVADPVSELERLALALAVEPDGQWLQAGAATVNDEVRLARDDVAWSAAQINRLLVGVRDEPVLRTYIPDIEAYRADSVPA